MINNFLGFIGVATLAVCSAGLVASYVWVISSILELKIQVRDDVRDLYRQISLLDLAVPALRKRKK